MLGCHIFAHLHNSLPSNWATSRGEKRTLKFCVAPGATAPTAGSTLKGGSSGFPIRTDITLARALEGRAPVSADDNLLPGREVEVPSVTDDTGKFTLDSLHTKLGYISVNIIFLWHFLGHG